MSAEAFFDAARAFKRELCGSPLTQADVDSLNAVIATWGKAKEPSKLARPADFFASVRAAFGALSQGQVDGFTFLLGAMGAARWPRSWCAYGLATAWHETNKALKPVEEAYYLGTKADAYRRTLRYYPAYGRGYVQLTWPKNYARADEECGLDGKLIADNSIALRPDIAAQILVKGMEQGWFTGKKLADYLPIDGQAGFEAFKAARRIINGTDRAEDIAKIAVSFDAALEAGGWAE